MGFADRKAAWIKSQGDPITILRPSGDVLTFARFVKGRQLMSPFDVNFVRFMVFPYDTDLARGDLIQNETEGVMYFVMATQEKTLEQGSVGVETELYAVNYPSVDVVRQSPAQVDDYGNIVPGTGGFQTVATVPMNVEHVNGQMLYKDGLLLQDTVFRLRCQVAADVQLNDRIIIDGKPYQVTDINLTISPGLQVIQVKTDTRT